MYCDRFSKRKEVIAIGKATIEIIKNMAKILPIIGIKPNTLFAIK